MNMETLEADANTRSLTDYLHIIKRRKKMIVISILILFEISIIVALILPPLYRSEATILIQQQRIPLDFVRSTVVSNPHQRIKEIEKEIMTVSSLNEIIDKFKLYPQQKNKLSPTDLAYNFQEMYHLEVINEKVVSHGRELKITLSFKLAFDHKNPNIAYQVTNKLISLFLHKNIETRTTRATETTAFLKMESEKFIKEIKQTESKIARYKQKYKRSLPELLPANLAAISKIEDALLQMRLEEKILLQRKMTAKSQLLITSPVIIATDGSIPESLPVLEAKYESLLRKYSTLHPSVKALKRSIRDFNNNTKDSLEVSNPSYLQLQSDIKLTEVAQNAINKRRKELDKKLTLIEKYVAQTPEIERGYYGLMRNLENYKNKYQELKSNLLEAQLSQSLEEDEKAEKFAILEPASFPLEPEKPQRFRILLIGFILAIGCGLGLGFLTEIIEGCIQGHQSLTTLTGIEPLVVIPYINNQDDLDQRSKNKKTMIFIVMSLTLLFIITVAVHFFYRRLYFFSSDLIELF